MKKLNRLISKIASRIPEEWELNRGGCGIFAMFLHEELKRHGIQTRFALLTNSEKRFFFFYSNKISGQKKACSHIVLQIKVGKDVMYIDTHGCRKFSKEQIDPMTDFKLIGFYSKYEMQKSIDDISQWNARYDRDKNSSVREIIQNCAEGHFKKSIFQKIFGQTTKIAA